MKIGGNSPLLPISEGPREIDNPLADAHKEQELQTKLNAAIDHAMSNVDQIIAATQGGVTSAWPAATGEGGTGLSKINNAIGEMVTDLQNQHKLEDEIQDLASQSNEAQQNASSNLKKAEDSLDAALKSTSL